MPTSKQSRLLGLLAVSLFMMMAVFVFSAKDALKYDYVKRRQPVISVGEVSLRYVPESTVRTWGERDFLLVLGILSVDIDGRRRRRYLQRTTCWRYPGVATRANAFTGEMLVLYVLARHPQQNYTYSAALQEEAAQYHDVLALSAADAASTTNRAIGVGGSWGIEADITMSRKTFLWFELALRLFPAAAYVAKGDDDVFLRVPRLLVDLRVLPRRGIYMGRYARAWFQNAGRRISKTFMAGMCYILSNDVVHQFVSYEPLRRLVDLPYSSERKAEFLSLHMNHEDVMVGRVVLLETPNPPSVVAVPPCQFHNIRNGTGHSQLTRESVVVHYPREDEYAPLMEMFSRDTSPRPSAMVRKGKKFMRLLCGG